MDDGSKVVDPPLSRETAPKPLVVFGINNELVLRDYLGSGILRRLTREFDLGFITANPQIEQRLAEIAPVMGRHRSTFLSYVLWDTSYKTTTENRWEPVIGRFGRRWYTHKTEDGWNWRNRLVTAISSLGLAGAYSAAARKALRWINGGTVQANLPRKPDLVVVPTIVRDYFAEEITRFAHRIGSPSLALQVNLDAFNIKAMLEIPDRVAVWGEQSWYLCRLACHIPNERLSLLGTPRYEDYVPMDRDAARRQLGRPGDNPLLLFAGSTAAFRQTPPSRLRSSSPTSTPPS